MTYKEVLLIKRAVLQTQQKPKPVPKRIFTLNTYAIPWLTATRVSDKDLHPADRALVDAALARYLTNTKSGNKIKATAAYDPNVLLITGYTPTLLAMLWADAFVGSLNSGRWDTFKRAQFSPILTLGNKTITGSTSWGPAQINKAKALEAMKTKQGAALFKNYINKLMMPRYLAMLAHGNNLGMQGYDPIHNYGGAGYPLGKNSAANYKLLTYYLLQQQAALLGKKYKAGTPLFNNAMIQRWRGVPMEKDPEYYKQVNARLAAIRQAKQAAKKQVAMNPVNASAIK